MFIIGVTKRNILVMLSTKKQVDTLASKNIVTQARKLQRFESNTIVIFSNT